MQTHEHTIMVWLEVWLSVFPCRLLGGEGDVFRKGRNSMISFFAVERGAGKRGRNLLHICGLWWYSGFHMHYISCLF